MKLFDEAIIYAVQQHSGAFRKGTSTPYIVHPLEAAAIAATMTDDEELWQRFNVHDKALHGWYYTSLVTALSELSGTAAWQEYSALAAEVFGGQEPKY